jgi:two-component system alkaline phosphatase synthesis response regulator PhoP
MAKKSVKNLIYIVDDEKNVRDMVATALNDADFETKCFEDGIQLLDELKENLPDLIILDWMMPKLDGLAVCGRVKLNRETKRIPVMMLTAKVEEVDCILGLEMGADDYVKKPFSPAELVSRVKTLLRRKSVSNQPEITDEILTIGEIKINLGNRTVTKNGRFLNLTMKEFDMLVSLVNQHSHVLTREELLDKVWKSSGGNDDRTVDVHIRYLRQKIEDVPDAPVYVKTVRGIGYRVASQEELDSLRIGVAN